MKKNYHDESRDYIVALPRTYINSRDSLKYPPSTSRHLADNTTQTEAMFGYHCLMMFLLSKYMFFMW